jgi:hypothetical protein
VVALLGEHDVQWILTGSFVLAACGAAIVPNDVDVTPALDPDNLRRLARSLEAIAAVPAYLPRSGPTLADCLAWTPTPTEANLDHLFVTSVGMVDVVPRLCGRYDELIATAVIVEVRGVRLVLCEPSRVLAIHDDRTRAKDLARAEAFAALRRQPTLAVQSARLAQLVA